MSDLFHRTPWPRRLWAPARIRYATSLSPDEIVARLADQSHGYTAPRDGSLSKIGYRMEVTPRGFKMFKVAGRFLGNPPRTIALLDATTVQTGAGTVINGEVRLPYPYLTMFCILWLARCRPKRFKVHRYVRNRPRTAGDDLNSRRGNAHGAKSAETTYPSATLSVSGAGWNLPRWDH